MKKKIYKILGLILFLGILSVLVNSSKVYGKVTLYVEGTYTNYNKKIEIKKESTNSNYENIECYVGDKIEIRVDAWGEHNTQYGEEKDWLTSGENFHFEDDEYDYIKVQCDGVNIKETKRNIATKDSHEVVECTFTVDPTIKNALTYEGAIEIVALDTWNEIGSTYTSKEKASLKIRVKINDLDAKIESAENKQDALKNAYKQTPSAYANADEIVRFITSDATYNPTKLGMLKTVPNSLATAWYETVKKAREKSTNKETYSKTEAILLDYISGRDIDWHQKELSDQAKNTEDVLEHEIQEYITIIAKLSGEDRVEGDFTDVLDDMNYYIGEDSVSSSDAKKIEEKVSLVLSVITNVGMILAVLIPAIVGVKYMLASVEEKAEYKKDMMPYVIGAALLFGICTFVKIAQSIGETINNI